MGIEDRKVTAVNMYKYKERLRLNKRWPCSTYILNRVNCIECRRVWELNPGHIGGRRVLSPLRHPKILDDLLLFRELSSLIRS